MSDNLPAIMGKALPAHLRKADTSINKDAAKGIGLGSINRISIKQSRFRLIVKGEEKQVIKDDSIPVFIVRASDAVHKAWYEKAYSSGQDNEAPDCYSEDGLRPAADSKKKQSASCATCPYNQWGSKITPAGKKAKACQDSKRLAVMPATKNPAGSQLWQLSVPATSMQSFARFVDMLQGLDPPVPYNAVLTKVSFDTDAEYPKINFEPHDYLPEAIYAEVAKRYDTDEAKMVCSNGNPDGAPPSSARDEEDEDPLAEEKAAAEAAEAAEAKAAKAKADKAAKAKAAKDAKAKADAEAEVPEKQDAASEFSFDDLDLGDAKDVTPPAKVAKTTEPAAVEEVAGEELDGVFGEGWDELEV